MLSVLLVVWIAWHAVRDFFRIMDRAGDAAVWCARRWRAWRRGAVIEVPPLDGEELALESRLHELEGEIATSQLGYTKLTEERDRVRQRLLQKAMHA